MDLLESMAVYVSTVELGSLSAAALATGMSATMAGNHLRSLEERLGMQLLQRTTRRQHITAFGQDYYLRCKDILRMVAETDLAAHDLQQAPSGTLRVSAPVSFGAEALIPALPAYMQACPDVKVDLALLDRVVDLAEEGFEVALRVGDVADTRLVARPLAPYRLMLCASPGYLARRGTPAAPHDLASHECLAFTPAALSSWHFDKDGMASDVPVTGRLQVNHGQALRVAALNGLGIVLQPAVLLEADVRAGRLVQLLPTFALPERPMHIVYHQDRYRSAKLRSFVDFVLQRFG